MTSEHASDQPSDRSGTDPAAMALHAAATIVERRLDVLLDAERGRWLDVDDSLGTPLTMLAGFAESGGKRIRPAFAYWSFVGAGGAPQDPRIADLCTALELLHMFALLHDDVMDGSATRRGRPTLHRRATSHHEGSAWRGEPRRFGEGVAILVGDLAFTYADQLTDGLPPDVLALYTELRLELVVGQYLDLESAARGDVDFERARRIAIHKAAKYTVERPLQLGATLAGRRAELEPELGELGMALGEAFQLRDDVLGVFGDETLLGKPVGDDLREGKATELVAVAVERADDDQRRVLDRLGALDLTDDEVAAIRATLVATGARDAIESRIEGLAQSTHELIDALDLLPDAQAALRALADFVAWRDH